MKSDVNIFLYYGVVLDRLGAYNIAIKNKETNFYNLIYANNLSYQMIGKTNYSDKMIVGEQMFWDYSKSLIKLDQQDLSLSTTKVEGNENQGPLQLDEERAIEIKNTLKKLGIEREPQYYFVSSYSII